MGKPLVQVSPLLNEVGQERALSLIIIVLSLDEGNHYFHAAHVFPPLLVRIAGLPMPRMGKSTKSRKSTEQKTGLP